MQKAVSKRTARIKLLFLLDISYNYVHANYKP